jgi:hypothetical protein
MEVENEVWHGGDMHSGIVAGSQPLCLPQSLHLAQMNAHANTAQSSQDGPVVIAGVYPAAWLPWYGPQSGACGL